MRCLKEWKSPDMIVLGGEFTAAGGNGGAIDGTKYDVTVPGLGRVVLAGTSGPALNLPKSNQ